MTSQMHIERTLLVFKPDSVQRAIVGEILTRFERVGLKIVGMKMVEPTLEHYHEHYEGIGSMKARRGELTFNNTVNYLQCGPVIAVVLQGVDAIEVVRKLTGGTEPKSAAIGTIRGDYCHVSYGRSDCLNVGVRNLIHTSADAKEAAQEIKLWFKDGEIFEYQTVHEKYTQ